MTLTRLIAHARTEDWSGVTSMHFYQYRARAGITDNATLALRCVSCQWTATVEVLFGLRYYEHYATCDTVGEVLDKVEAEYGEWAEGKKT